MSWDVAKEEGEKIAEDEGCEEREDPKIETIRVGVPIAGKTKEDVLSGVAGSILEVEDRRTLCSYRPHRPKEESSSIAI